MKSIKRIQKSHTFKPAHILVFLIVVPILLLAFEKADEHSEKTYTADIQPLNESVTGRSPHGSATLTIKGNSLTISIEVMDLPPNMMHLQHYHGFVDGSKASCASMDQDKNNDGIIDLIETQQVSGITLVPFHDDPASLKIKTETYPKADQNGQFSYKKTVSLDELTKSLKKTHNIEKLMLENRVIYIHGISQDKSLPETVQSLPEVPAHITLPIACGMLKLKM